MVNNKYSLFFLKIIITSYFLVSNNPSTSIIENSDSFQALQENFEENGKS
jgi:hypothetical protein